MTWYIKIPSFAVDVYSSQRVHRDSPGREVDSKSASLTALVAEVRWEDVDGSAWLLVLLGRGLADA
jgi:hypothetical protein